MTQATTNQTASAPLQMARSYILSSDKISEKARINLPVSFDRLAFEKIETYVGDMASKGLNAKDRYDITLEFAGYKATKQEHVTIVASTATKKGVTPARSPQLMKIVDKMVEEVSKIILSNSTDITIRNEAGPSQ